MRIRITAEYIVKETERGIDVLDSDGFCLCTGEDLGVAMHSLSGMVEEAMLDPETFTAELINVLPSEAS